MVSVVMMMSAGGVVDMDREFFLVLPSWILGIMQDDVVKMTRDEQCYLDFLGEILLIPTQGTEFIFMVSVLVSEKTLTITHVWEMLFKYSFRHYLSTKTLNFLFFI